MSETMNARDFMNIMENLINSPTQKLIGDISNGYAYAENVKPELMYAAAEVSRAKHEAQKVQEKNRADALQYALTMCELREERRRNAFDIRKVIFNDPATIVYWADGTKTVVKAKNEPFDLEKGLAMAIAKKVYGNTGYYYNLFRDHIQPYHEQLLNKIRKLQGQGKTEKEIADVIGVKTVAKFRELKANLLREERSK